MFRWWIECIDCDGEVLISTEENVQPEFCPLCGLECNAGEIDSSE